MVGGKQFNLSGEVPDTVYMFLDKGLGYAPFQKVDIGDWKYAMTI